MAYLIPKSARNIKIQLFKGLGIFEATIVVLAGLAAFIIVSIFGFSLGTLISVIFLVLITIFLVTPSFLVNKKGYQLFEVLITYFNQQKIFAKKRKVTSKHERK